MSDNLIAEARRAQKAVYLATEKSVADDLARIIGGLADALEAATRERDAAEARIERWMQLVGKGVEERMTAEAERDAALAAIERVAKKIEAVAGGTTTSSEAAGYRNGLLRAAQIVRAALDGGGEE